MKLTRLIHELFEMHDNLLKYIIKWKSPKKQSVFCAGWKACATGFFAADELSRIVKKKINIKYIFPMPLDFSFFRRTNAW